MFILYAIPIGLALGWLLGGRLEGLAAVRVRFGALAVIALAIQVVLFSPLVAGLGAAIEHVLYVGSTALVGLVVLANHRLTGLRVVALGAACNLAAIIANGGEMPADPGALASLGMGVDGQTNSIIVADAALRPLTDIFALPPGLPLANIFSVGDVLIGVGVVIAVAGAMRAAPGRTASVDPGHRSS